MKGKTLGAISGLVAALGLAGCTERYDYVNNEAAQFAINAGWKYVSHAYTVEDEVKDKDCFSQFQGFRTRVVSVTGVNKEGNVEMAEMCCIIEEESYTAAFNTHNITSAGYCDFLKQ